MSNKMEDKAMKSATERALAPKLRFPGFRDKGEWSKEKLGVVATLYKGKGISKADIVANGVQPCIRYGELYTIYGETIHEIASSTNVDASELFLSRKNDVIIPASGETKIDIAKASCVMRDDVALGGDLNVIRSSHNGIFLSYQLNGPLRLSIAKVAQGDTVVHLYPSQIERLDVLLPSPIEQQKIADCLSSIDELVTLEAQKLDTLKAHKKGLMQRLFPAEGETLPKLRFPEFREAGEWEEKRLIDVLRAEIREVAKPSSSYLGLGIRCHGKGTFLKPDQAPEKNSMDRLYLVHCDDLIVSITFAWEGAIAIAGNGDHGSYVSHRFPTYVFNPLASMPAFFRYVITNKAFVYKLGLISPGGAGRNRVMNKNDFLNISVLLPSLPEQQEIADCLSSIDALITAQAKKLAALKTHKKGLMQQLFPALDEVTS